MRGVRLRNPIVYLITDAEEAGLIGAEAFVADQSLLKSVAAVVNIEARGTKGHRAGRGPDRGLCLRVDRQVRRRHPRERPATRLALQHI